MANIHVLFIYSKYNILCFVIKARSERQTKTGLPVIIFNHNLKSSQVLTVSH